jgi:hypothetical protein
MAAVTLPAVGGSCLGLAPDGVAASTLLTEPAASDVVDDHPVIDAQVPHSGPDLHDLPARFVAGDDAAVSLSTTAGVLRDTARMSLPQMDDARIRSRT